MMNMLFNGLKKCNIKRRKDIRENNKRRRKYMKKEDKNKMYIAKDNLKQEGKDSIWSGLRRKSWISLIVLGSTVFGKDTVRLSKKRCSSKSKLSLPVFERRILQQKFM
ncbi:hypothetical protein K501DRAFT_279528 [Backusella circina FSU 941]|nr:hypothetical protein K501DRAFT_279528 [Backusella circina FSU 941]